jgi:hypothetical protein
LDVLLEGTTTPSLIAESAFVTKRKEERERERERES